MEACRLLQAYVGNSLRAIQNELDKLFTYLGERNAHHTGRRCGRCRCFARIHGIRFTKCNREKNIAEAMRIVKRMIETGESPQLSNRDVDQIF